MAYLKFFIVLLAVVAAVSQPLVAPRLIGGVPIDTLRRFPYHVAIEKKGWYDSGERSLCGGSILNEQWVLTSALCVDRSDRLELHFERLYLNQTIGSYTAVVNSDAVHIYPTYYDDIALVKLPFRLIFSDLIKPVSITTQSLAQLENKLAVLPGFDVHALHNANATDQLTYAMLNVISNNKCKQYHNSDNFDEYLQLCTQGYSNNSNAPCLTDYGSGLVAGWPAKSELIGIYSGSSYDCSSESPAIYTNVAKYASWIQSLINQPA